MSGSDVIGQAQTGTGKTAAFGIPILQTVDPSNKKTQVIILSPTRELAIQVADEIRALAKYMHGVKVLPVYGGQEISKQIRSLKDSHEAHVSVLCLRMLHIPFRGNGYPVPVSDPSFLWNSENRIKIRFLPVPPTVPA